VKGVVDYYHDIAPTLLLQGGFPASQDADHSPDDDGDYWTWTREEIAAALKDDELTQIALAYYGLDDPAGSMHLDRSRHVLFRAPTTDALASRFDSGIAEIERRVQHLRTALKIERDRRPAPYVDATIYPGWTALVASGFIAAQRFAGIDGAADTAVRALGRVMRDAFKPDIGVLHRVDDPHAGVHVDDQAHMLIALIDAFEQTQDAVWLDHATSVAGVLHRRFLDPAVGALRDRPIDDPGGVATLERPYFPIADAPSPSGNGAAALGLLRLHAYTGNSAAADDARAILRAFAGSAGRLGSAAATYMKALAWDLGRLTTVVVVEEADGPMWKTALRSVHPRTVIRRFEPGLKAPDQVRKSAARPPRAPSAALPPELAAMLTGDAPRGYVCTGNTCAEPATDAVALTQRLHEIRS
jgi:uncharacterized protein YyaL (SSP411 family)